MSSNVFADGPDNASISSGDDIDGKNVGEHSYNDTSQNKHCTDEQHSSEDEQDEDEDSMSEEGDGKESQDEDDVNEEDNDHSRLPG